MKARNILSISFVILLAIFSFLILSNSDNHSITGAVVLGQVEDVIGDVTKEQAEEGLVQAEKDMSEMKAAGFGINLINDTLIDARRYFISGDSVLVKDLGEKSITADYAEVVLRTNTISVRKTQAYEIKDNIRATELMLVELNKTGLNLTPVFILLDRSKVEFDNERYENSVDNLNEIDSKLDDIRVEGTFIRTAYRIGRETLIVFVQENWPWLLVILIVLIIVLIFSWKKIQIARLEKKIVELELEDKVSKDLLKKAQVEYYRDRSLTKQSYDIRVKNYKDRITELKHTIPVLTSRLNKMKNV
jgi:hypothetical protein